MTRSNRARRIVATLLVGSILAPAAPVLAATARVAMAPHRALYELSLAGNSGEKGVEQARGRIVFEFAGTACEGYTLTFRQVTELSGGDIGTRLTDMRSTTFEDADGASLRFNTESRVGGNVIEASDGSAERKGEGLRIILKKPAGPPVDLKDSAVFPTAQTRMLIEAAQAGQSTLGVKIFDGSEGGKKVYDTFSVIGKVAQGEAGLEEPLVKAGWGAMQRWPVSISYFEAGQAQDKPPLYVISFELLENGVSRNLRLDYGSFTLKGELTRLDLIKAAACDK